MATLINDVEGSTSQQHRCKSIHRQRGDGHRITKLVHLLCSQNKWFNVD